MDSGDTNHIVLTLEDDMSNQLLESKREQKTKTGPSSIELWIKSLKDANDLTDDSKSDQDNNDSCSDQDDLQLGAEATDLHRKKQRAQYNSISSTRDSDSEDNRYLSRRARSPFLMKKLSYDQSLDSDTSGLSSIASVSSLLTSRESDPEDVLKGLGFCGPNVIDNIPDRFINAGTRCDGVDTKQFFDSVWDESEDALYGTSSLPPWVMARADDIPIKFLQSNNLTNPGAPESSKTHGVPLINEPTTHPEGINEDPHSRPSKPQPFTSKFGTFLEPVTEEVELSSQGSVTLSPGVGKNFSFESNRSSTLKSNSHDEPSETVMRIPSLKDLWGTETTENETEHISGEDFESSEMLTYDVVEYSPALDSTQNEAPAVSNSQRSFPEREGSIPTLLDYFAGDGILGPEENHVPFQVGNGTADRFLGETPRDNDTLSFGEEEKDVCTKESSELPEDFKFRQPRGIKIPIPIVKISEPVERSRKISTIQVPDPQKLVPLILEESSANLTPDSASSSTSVLTKKRGRQQHGHNGRQNGTMQLNLYEKWVVIKKSFQRQIQFSNNVKDSRRVSSRNCKMTDAKIVVTKKHPRVPKQLVLPQSQSRVIECFLDVDTRCVSKRRMFKTTSSAAVSASCSEDSSGFVSQATRSNSSTPENHCDQKNYLKLLRVSPSEKAEGLTEDQGRHEERGLCSCPMGTHGKTEPANPCSNVWRSRNGQLLKNGVSVQEELDGLQSCLKGVKVYKAGIHLMQLASSVETVISSESRPVGLKVRSSEVLLDSIQKEIKQLEEYILHLQTRLTDLVR